MKFCTKCGNQMTDDMIFCQKCGTKDLSVEEASFEQINIHKVQVLEQSETKHPKLRTSMKIWMIISFVLAGIFAIGSSSDASMIAGVCLFGILGVMFLFLAKTPKGPVKLFAEWECFKKTQGVSKGIFVFLCVLLAISLFSGIINSFDTTANDTNTTSSENTSSINTNETSSNTKIPAEFSEECPISVSASMQDSIIGFPQLNCVIENKTDKEISAVQFYFLPKDVYGEKIEGIFAQNKLQYDTPISSKETTSAVWQMIEQNVKSGDLFVYSVYFSDGTEWGDRNAPTSKIKKYSLEIQVSY